MKIITLCGSSAFEETYREINKKLTLEGNVVFSCGVFEHKNIEKEKNRIILQKVHKKKIDLSDEIFVINIGGYIGKHTDEEIKYARKKGKKIKYLYKDDQK